MADFPFALPPKQSNGLIYTGYGVSIMPCVQFPRAPKPSDINYPLFTLWRNSNNINPVLPDAFGDMWYLAYAYFVGTLQQAKWIKLSGGGGGPAIMFPVPNGTSPVVADAGGNVTLTSTGGTITITGGLNTINFDLSGGSTAIDTIAVQATTAPGVSPVTPTAAGLVTFNGNAVANHSVPVESRSRALNAYNLEVQYGATAAATDATKSGLIHADSAQFSLDANGFLQLVGGTAPALQKLNVDAHTAPGTDPVVPDGSGQIILTGAQVAAGTVGANVIRTDSLAANTCTIEIQRSTTAAASDTTKNGVSHYDSAAFTVGAGGFVQLVGGATPPVQSVDVDAHTAPGTDPVLADGTGKITVTGAQVAAGTVGANVIRTDSLAANAYTIEIQRSTTAASADSTKNGVCHFNSAQFTVDSNGFVSSTGSFGPSSTIQLFDDFIGADPTTTTICNSNYSWFMGGSPVFLSATTTSNSHPGIIANDTAAATTWVALYLGNTIAGPGADHTFILGGGAIQLNWVINTATLSTGVNRYILRVGMADTATVTTDPSNGVYFEYSDNINSGNWTIKTANGGVRTTANTSTAVGTGFVNLGITINAAATSIAYTVNGVAVANSPLTTNIPTAAISPFIKMSSTVGTVAAGSVLVDLFYMTQTLTTPR